MLSQVSSMYLMAASVGSLQGGSVAWLYPAICSRLSSIHGANHRCLIPIKIWIVDLWQVMLMISAATAAGIGMLNLLVNCVTLVWNIVISADCTPVILLVRIPMRRHSEDLVAVTSVRSSASWMCASPAINSLTLS